MIRLKEKSTGDPVFVEHGSIALIEPHATTASADAGSSDRGARLTIHGQARGVTVAESCEDVARLKRFWVRQITASPDLAAQFAYLEANGRCVLRTIKEPSV